MKTAGGLQRDIRRKAHAILKDHPRMRLAARHVYWGAQRMRYDRLARKVAVDPKVILFESFQGRGFGDSPKALYLQALADPRFADFVFIWSFADANHVPQTGLDDVRTIVVLRGTEDYFRAVALAKFLIMNMRLPEFVYPKADQRFIQCWHGTPLKRLANDIIIETANAMNTGSELAWRYRIDSQKWSTLVSASPYATSTLCSAFGLPEEERADKVLEVGDPGNDVLVRARDDAQARAHVQQALGVPAGKKVLLYAPTWRDDSYKPGEGYVIDYLCDMDALYEALGDEWVVLFRAHYFIVNDLDFAKYGDFVVDASHAEDINTCYIASDVLVTDYSSVMFDYPNLRRPLLLFTPDLAHYDSKIRGFYFDIHDVPGPLCETTEQLIDALKGIETYFDDYGAEYDAFVERFCPYDDGCASTRVLDALID